MRRLRFLTSNALKLAEAAIILERLSIRITGVSYKIEELQTEDSSRLARVKALKAFEVVGRPLFVEHTGLSLAYLNGFPGGLTQLFWDSLGADRFAELYGRTPDPSAAATTHIVYCDGRRFHEFVGEAQGRIASMPAGDRGFQWDCVFIPDGFDATYAELGPEKNEISMRVSALKQFARYLQEDGGR